MEKVKCFKTQADFLSRGLPPMCFCGEQIYCIATLIPYFLDMAWCETSTITWASLHFTLHNWWY